MGVSGHLFRGRFLAALRHAFDSARLDPRGLLSPAVFARILDDAAQTDWVVYAKPPFDGPHSVLSYLARYTHRTAISNHRLLDVDNDSVTFRYTDYRSRRPRRLTLSLDEFVRRFLLHVLRTAFVRIRYYGFLANGCRARLLAICRAALDPPTAPSPEPSRPSPSAEPLGDLLGDLLPRHLRLCPNCKAAPLRCVQLLERPPPSRLRIHATL